MECRAGSWADGSTALCQRPVKCTTGQGPKAGATFVTDCMTCPPGYYSDHDDETPCEVIQCTPGFYSDAVGATDATKTCTACPASTYSTGLNDVCHDCAFGEFSLQGDGVCSPLECPLNSEPTAHATNTTDCLPCAVGTFSAGGTNTCEPMQCPRGTEPKAAPSSISDCDPCALGKFSTGGSSVCEPTTCLPGFVAVDLAWDGVDSCKRCDAGYKLRTVAYPTMFDV
ncbi:hypothetical protein AaE_006914 [Aphanomyces astaci]|uniref:Tyrosine-protein kinase ephrin type A/B receptor-like domain-containing protein n=1 Tax=Aphanomyces astaci TaxID=112090 RepID=A0A6A5AC12_APHAT|nr:hypothetical protein AaE_006914 [Aphanomyces astaci]